MTFQPDLPLVFIILITLAFVAFILFNFFSKKHEALPLRRVVILLLFLLMLLRPSIKTGGAVIAEAKRLNVFFAIDLSGSMVAKDCTDGDEKIRRIEKAKQDMRAIIGLLPNAHFAIVVYDITARPLLPLTEDDTVLYTVIDSLSLVPTAQSHGSDLGNLMTVALQQVDASWQREKTQNNLLFLFSDGEDTGGNAILMPNKITRALKGGGIYGYGSHLGYIERIGYDGIADDYVTETNHEAHISKLNTAKLQEIADKVKLPYQTRTDGRFAERAGLNTDELLSANYRETTMELYWLFALALVALVLGDFSLILNVLLDERKAENKK